MRSIFRKNIFPGILFFFVLLTFCGCAGKAEAEEDAKPADGVYTIFYTNMEANQLVRHKYTPASENFDGILSVNISPLQFKEKNFMKKLRDKVLWSKVNPKHLELEITEGILIDDFDDILAKLNQIKDMEISISLDDFGTGYSSIRYLRVLPISTLKIDKSFIENITLAGNKETEITESIVSMVAKMGLDTVAEGVETNEQYETLKGFGEKKVNVQGFLKGKPMPKYLCDKILSGEMNVIQSLENDLKVETQENA